MTRRHSDNLSPSPLRNFLALFLLALIPCPIAADDQPASDQQSPSWKEFFATRQGQYFYGIYMLGGKVGWVSEHTRLQQTERGEVVTSEQHGEIRIKLFGNENRLLFDAQTVYSLSGDGPLIYAEESSTDGESKSHSTATAEPSGYAVVLENEGQVRRMQAGPSQDNLRAVYDTEIWLGQPRKVGDTLKSYTFEFDNLGNAPAGSERPSPDDENTLTFVKTRPGRWGGVPVTLTEVRAKMGSMNANLDLLPDGTPVTLAFGPMTARLEEEAIAKNIELVVGDMLASVKVNKDLGPPQKVRKATIELQGLGDFQVPQTASQQVLETRAGYALLALERDRQADQPTPLSPKDLAALTAATLRVQSDHERIAALAREIVGDETDPVKRAARLQEWVFTHIDGSYSKNADTALRVLDNKAGDCTENALLFVALARSLSIPAREVGGLIFSNDDQPAFYWHAWAEIHDGGHWIGVDPSFNEVRIDAAHILMEQDATNNFTSATVIGQLKIRIVDFETDS